MYLKSTSCAVRKLSVDPLLTGNLDDSSTEEDEPQEVVETPPATKDKHGKKGKSPRRIWGKKFKVIFQQIWVSYYQLFSKMN